MKKFLLLGLVFLSGCALNYKISFSKQINGYAPETHQSITGVVKGSAKKVAEFKELLEALEYKIKN